jgi:hypothetical protein
MLDMSIRWKQEPFICELRVGKNGTVLHMYIGGRLFRSEPVASAVAAYDLASEVSKGVKLPVSSIRG